jgi:cyclophilin family peptidyl-prolyl cis-trans isomerase
MTLGPKSVATLAISFLVAASCVRAKSGDDKDSGPDARGPDEVATIARAEDARRARDIPDALRTSHDGAIRRRVARALARIADPQTDEALLRALSDEDEEVVGWGAYGLGWTCKGREDAHVRALAARAASLEGSAPGLDADAAPTAIRVSIDARTAIVRAIGRCGGTLAEPVLAAWVRARNAWSRRACYGLGDVAARRGLSDDTYTALLEAAEGGPANPPIADALYPFGRVERVAEAFSKRLILAARAVLEHSPEARSLAVRALGRSGKDAAQDLARAAENKDLGAALRAEAGRALGPLDDAGRAAAAEAVARLTPDQDPVAIGGLTGDEFGILRSLVLALGGEPPRKAEPALYALANLSLPGLVAPTLLRRIHDLRCVAAGALAKGAYDAEVLKNCDPDPSSEAGERARLAALVRRPLTADRRLAWRALTKSVHARIREGALEAIGQHAELGDAARVALIEALGAPQPGVVGTAAEVIHAHPDRVLALAASERRNALDPRAPPPSVNPVQELDKDVAAALQAALSRVLPEDLIETRIAILEALVATHHKSARDAATLACKDPNVTLRDHAARALRALGDTNVVCPVPDAATGNAGAARPVPSALARPTRVTFVTDVGELGVVFEPDLAPVAAARLVELARTGFFDGIVVHRVVPGFVVQFGDPGGDGYGGAGETPLRCETAPVPFEPLDVGVALAGRDTGSSQIFVTLGRFPHLDGEYSRVGRAEGDWLALAEGDIIRKAKVE